MNRPPTRGKSVQWSSPGGGLPVHARGAGAQIPPSHGSGRVLVLMPVLEWRAVRPHKTPNTALIARLTEFREVTDGAWPRESRWWHAAAVLLLLIGALAMGGPALGPGPAHAQDKDLSEGHPVRLGDAFFVSAGEGTLLATAGAFLPRQGVPHGLFALEGQYGILKGSQLSVATLLSTLPAETHDPSSGDVTVAFRQAFGSQKDLRPALAAQLAATLPTGDGSRSVDLELKGYATESVMLGPLPTFLHFNASAEFRATERASDERLVRYHLAFGPSFTVPAQATTTVVADVYVDQALKRHDPETVGMELGVRHRLAPRLAFHGAVGTEVAGPSNRAAMVARLGLTFGFAGPPVGRPRPSP